MEEIGIAQQPNAATQSYRCCAAKEEAAVKETSTDANAGVLPSCDVEAQVPARL